MGISRVASPIGLNFKSDEDRRKESGLSEAVWKELRRGQAARRELSRVLAEYGKAMDGVIQALGRESGVKVRTVD